MKILYIISLLVCSVPSMAYTVYDDNLNSIERITKTQSCVSVCSDINGQTVCTLTCS